MARVINNNLFKGVSGRIGDIVIKQYSYGTVITKVPQFPKRRKKSEFQQLGRKHFADAVRYAQGILRNPQKKAAYAAQLKPGEKVYYAAIKEFLRKNRGKTEPG